MTSVAYGLKSPHSLRISFSPTARRLSLFFFHGIRQTSESALWIIHIEGVYRRAKLIISRPAIYRNRSQCNGSCLFYLQTVGTGSRIRRRTITAGTTITSTALCTANDSAATGATRRGNWWSARCRPWSKRQLIGLNKYIFIIIYFLFHQIHHGRGYWIPPLDRVLYQSISLLHIYIYPIRLSNRHYFRAKQKLLVGSSTLIRSQSFGVLLSTSSIGNWPHSLSILYIFNPFWGRWDIEQLRRPSPIYTTWQGWL